MIRMLVTCNGAPGTRMDRAYYATTHIQLALHLWGPYGLEKVAAFFPAADGNGVLSIGIYEFRDAAAMEAALASDVTATIMADVPNFTDSTCIERSVWAPMGDGVSQSSRGGHDDAGTPSGAGTVQQQEPGP